MVRRSLTAIPRPRPFPCTTNRGRVQFCAQTVWVTIARQHPIGRVQGRGRRVAAAVLDHQSAAQAASLAEGDSGEQFLVGSDVVEAWVLVGAADREKSDGLVEPVEVAGS